MAIRKLPALSVASPLAPDFPSHDELTVFAWLFRDATRSRNRASGGGALSTVGSGPTYSDTYVTMGAGSGIRTPVTGIHSAITVMTAIRKASGGGGTYHRVWNIAGNAVLFWRNTDDVLICYGANGTSYQAELTIQDNTAWHVIAVAMGGSDVVRVRNLTEGTEAEGGLATAPTTATSTYLEFNVSSATPTTQTRTLDWAWAAHLSKRLTDVEQDAFYDAIQPRLLIHQEIAA